jgi:hypothetical protein
MKAPSIVAGISVFSLVTSAATIEISIAPPVRTYSRFREFRRVATPCPPKTSGDRHREAGPYLRVE